MAKREAFVYALSMKANNLSIIKSRRGWVIKKKKNSANTPEIKKTKEKKRKKKNSHQAKSLLFTAKNKTKQNKNLLRANVSKYRPEVYKREKRKFSQKFIK